jgi:hypothetical protein
MRVLAVSLALGAFVGAGCASSGGMEASTESAAEIDVVAGTYGGVGIDATPEQVARVYGTALETEGAAEPLAAERFRGPTFIPAPGALGGAPPPMLRYEDVAFLTDGETVYVVIVEAQGAETERTVAVGDPLSEAIDAYELDCEPVVGSDDEDVYRGCFGKVARDRYVWFGGDPIANISFGRVPLTAGPDDA